LDFPGAFLLVGASVLLLTALQMATEQLSFRSAEVLAPLILSPICLAAFLGLQKAIDAGKWELDSVMPWRLLTNRLFVGNIWSVSPLLHKLVPFSG
jgi:hypothetical protein